jgi:methionyl-tRNA formyltransferase
VGDINSYEGDDWLKKINPDIGIMFGYPRKLKNKVIDRFNKFVLNAHPSDLPKNRGNFPLHSQILNNDDLVVPIYKVDTGLDSGPWIFKTMPLKTTYLSNEEVYGLVKQQVTLALFDILNKIKNSSNLEVSIQDEKLSTYADSSFYSKLFQKINWKNDAKKISNIILAAGIRNGISTSLLLNEDIIDLRVHSAYFVNMKHNYKIGRLIAIESDSYKIAAENGFVIIEDLRNKEGSKFNSEIINLDSDKDIIFI